MRLLRPSLAVFCLALLASLCIHLPVYEVLGALAHALLRSTPGDKPGVVELELAPLADSTQPEPPPAKPESPKATKPKAPEPEKPIEPAVKPEPEKKKKLELEPKPQIAEAVPAKPLPVPTDRPLAVTQKSDNPNEAPDHAKFIADENRKVEEETVARARNMQRDDTPEATAGPTKTNEDEGNSDETKVRDLRNEEGREERAPDRREAERKHDRPSEASAGRQEATGSPRPGGDPQQAQRELAPSRASGSPQTGGEPETIVVRDGVGTFRIRKAPPGLGPGQAGGAQRPGKPTNERQERQGARAQVGSAAPNLRMSWSQFEDTFGADDLREQREAYLAQRRSSSEGHSRQRSWKEFRAAIENFVPNVRPGDQTALNAAADPFANYLAEVHRRIHRRFAFEFLESLPLAGGPYGDYSLHTELEIVINGDGSINHVGVAETSGFLPFDYGAYNAVMKAGPYPVPPSKILSGDGRVYVRWGFYRNERQCGTFNARPYILPHPPGTPQPGHGPEHDPGEHGPATPAHQAGEGELGFNEAWRAAPW